MEVDREALKKFPQYDEDWWVETRKDLKQAWEKTERNTESAWESTKEASASAWHKTRPTPVDLRVQLKPPIMVTIQF